MPELFGRAYSADELRRFTGGMEQLAGIQPVQLGDGRLRGARAAEVWTGSGLRFTVLLDRGMDIGAASYGGVPLAWQFPAAAAPQYYEPQGYGWLRTFGGGLLTTGGLTHFGQPETDNNEHYGLHGRVSHLPAEEVNLNCAWSGEDYLLTIEGSVRQAVILGENLRLRRRISTRLGADSLLVEDTLSNEGFRPTPFMLLYHCNFGFPIVSPDSLLYLDSTGSAPRGDPGVAWARDYDHFTAPDPKFSEQVFFHIPRPDGEGNAAVALFNPELHLGARLRYRAAELPALTEWKLLGAGEYVVGLEPCTMHESARAWLRQKGQLKTLQPGESIQFKVEIGVIKDISSI